MKWLSRRLSIFALILFASLFAGCTTTSGKPPTQIQGIEDDQFSKNIKINGAKLYVNPFGGVFREWLIRSWVDKTTGSVSHQLYVHLSYIGDWKYFIMAADDTAKSLSVVRIASNVGSCSGGCSLDEAVGIDLDDVTLRSRVNQGYPIKLSAKSGDAEIITISPEQIKLQLEAIDKNLSQRRAQ